MGADMNLQTDSKPRIGFIGAGRVGLALSRALARAGERVSAVYSRSRASAQALAEPIRGCESVDGAQQVIERAEIVFLSVPDDAIASVASSLVWRPGVAAVHCSGAAELSVLEAAREQGARVGGFHPLQMFAEPEIAAKGLARCAIAVEGEQSLVAELTRLAETLGARTLRVPPGHRPAYHAASHYAAAFICVLLAEGAEILERIGMGGETAAQVLLPLAHGALEAVDQAGPARAMAGAYARGDIGTAARHLEALDALDAGIGAFYRELAARSVALALKAGRIDDARAAALRALLKPRAS